MNKSLTLQNGVLYIKFVLLLKVDTGIKFQLKSVKAEFCHKPMNLITENDKKLFNLNLKLIQQLTKLISNPYFTILVAYYFQMVLFWHQITNRYFNYNNLC